MKNRILAISAPGDDRGPGVMFRNHIKAVTHKDSEIEIVPLTQEIWDNDAALSSFDAAWGYVRFHPGIVPRLRQLGVPIIGGPNIVMERADAGITDEYEWWYLTQPSVDVNLNVAEYYKDHVQKFVTNGMRCEVLEGCYDVSSLNFEKSKRDIDVLLYHKVRVNDDNDKALDRLNLLNNKLKSKNLQTEIIVYGSHSREDYFSLCRRSKTVAWLSIEDYASIAQIEAHLLGSCVVGTPYNLTIPSFDATLCHNSQDMNSWITWKDAESVSEDYLNTILQVIDTQNLDERVHTTASERHGYKRYRDELSNIIGRLK
jgi:hypothetical protein